MANTAATPTACPHQTAIEDAKRLDQLGWPPGNPDHRMLCNSCDQWVDSSGQVGPPPTWLQDYEAGQQRKAAAQKPQKASLPRRVWLSFWTLVLGGFGAGMFAAFTAPAVGVCLFVVVVILSIVMFFKATE